EVQERLLQRALTLRETKAKDQRDRNSDSDNHPVDGPVRELLDEEHKGNQQDHCLQHGAEVPGLIWVGVVSFRDEGERDERGEDDGDVHEEDRAPTEVFEEE